MTTENADEGGSLAKKTEQDRIEDVRENSPPENTKENERITSIGDRI